MLSFHRARQNGLSTKLYKYKLIKWIDILPYAYIHRVRVRVAVSPLWKDEITQNGRHLNGPRTNQQGPFDLWLHFFIT